MIKQVLITGGSGGIGRSLVTAFSKADYRVFFTYHSSRDAALVLEKMSGARGFCVNFEETQSVVDFAESFLKEFGGVDVLINDAGVSHYGLIQDVTVDDFRRVFSVNFQSPFFLTQKLVSAMIARNCGTIINIASVWGETGASCEVLYSSSKGAVVAFTKALAKELAPSGITVNCISPGVVDTEMMSRFSDEEKGALREEIPSGRFTREDEVAKVALYLAENSTTSLTGQIIGLNGGMYC